MNLPGPNDEANVTSSVLVDDPSQESRMQAEVAQDDQTETSDLAKMLGEKICKKANLKQLFFSLSIDFQATQEMQKNVRMKMAAEMLITKLLKSL